MSGTGTAENPYRVEAVPIRLAVSDTPSIGLTLTGDGTLAEPYVVSADFTGEIPVPDWTPAESRLWGGGVSLTDVTAPRTLRVTLVGNVTGLAMPTWDSSSSGSLNIVLTQDASGSRTVHWTGVVWEDANPPTLTTTPGGKDLIRLLWTGLFWVGDPVAMNLG